MSEFNLIAQYFTRPAHNADLGVGDDAALVRVTEGHQLAISADMLVAGTHFFHDAAPFDIGWKSMAVNISDMAAMGATPKWATLAIALPDVNATWLAEFSRGFFTCADTFGVSLIGGDTTRGPLTISVQMMGEVPTNQALRRDGAQVNDDIWVSGTLGSAALGLAHLQGNIMLEHNALQPQALSPQSMSAEADHSCLMASLHALCRPVPRANLGLALRGIAHSCIDISDGLLADLGHILKASNLGATLQLASLPCCDFLRERLNQPAIQVYVLAGGDDYELCFTTPASKRAEILQLSQNLALPLTCIGQVTQEAELNVYDKNGERLTLNNTGFDHFS